MADTSNLTQFLTDVANAIKEKTGKTDKIPAANFDTEIRAIQTGGSSGIKQFNTVEEMNSSTGNSEGDSAVIYRNEVRNATVDSKFQVATFPDTVVLDSAITDSIEVRYRAVDSSIMFDGMGSLDSSMFRMDCYTESGEMRIQYTSSDGITYTRTDTTGNPVDFGTEIYYGMAENWNDAIGKFIQVGGNVFEGLFEYSPYLDENEQYLPDYSTLSYIDNHISIKTGKNIITIDQVKAIINALDKKDYVTYDIVYDGTYYYILPYIKSASYANCYYDKDNAKLYFTISANAQTTGSPYFESIPPMIYVLDNNLKLHSTIDTSTLSTTIFVWGAASANQYKVTELPLSNQTMILRVKNSNNAITVSNESFFYGSGIGAGVTSSQSYIVKETYVTKYRWEVASTQLTTTANDVYKTIFYGKDGVETGTLTENISYSFADVNAEMYDKIQKTYAAMEPKVLTNKNDIDRNIYFIPVNAKGQPLLDTSAITDMNSIFYNCTNLTTIPLLNTSNVVNIAQAFMGCKNLTAIAQLDTSKVTTMEYMFHGCTNLKTIPSLNTSNVKGMHYMFDNCTSLSDDSLNNILEMCTNATKITSNKTLNYIGLTKEQANKCKTLSNYSAFTAAGWTIGYINPPAEGEGGLD